MGPSRATSVLFDMYKFGIEPSVNTLTVLATGFARVGELRYLGRLVERMEKTQVELELENSLHEQSTVERLNLRL